MSNILWLAMICPFIETKNQTFLRNMLVLKFGSWGTTLFQGYSIKNKLIMLTKKGCVVADLINSIF